MSVDFLWQSFKYTDKLKILNRDMRFPTILTSVDSDEPVQSPFKLETPNDVQSVV